MNAPRHLWSGDWREESDAAAERRAKRPGSADERAEDPPAPAPAPEPPARPRSIPAARRGQYRAAILVALATLLSAGAAYAVVSLLVGSGSRTPAVASGGAPWLGVNTTSFPFGGGGALIADVTAGSPAQAGGLLPGDVITQIGGRPVSTSADVAAALAGMHAGERVDIQFQRGPVDSTTQVTLAARPPNP